MEPSEKLSGEIEADETFIGGKARNMHVDKRARRFTGMGGKDKTAVMDILKRSEECSKVRTKVIPNRKKAALQADVKKHVEAGSALYTDTLLSYDVLPVSSPIESWVTPNSTSMEDPHERSGKLLELAETIDQIDGTYVSAEPFHLFRYLDEQAYPFNNRK
jgi:transposase-like protein